MMNLSVEFEINKRTENGLKRIPDDFLYQVARQTLDRSQPLIPMSNIPHHKGTLRRSSFSRGVGGSNGDYYIGSYTGYASSVWSMPSATTNWTTPGTNNKWFARTLKEKGKSIIESALNQSWKENM